MDDQFLSNEKEKLKMLSEKGQFTEDSEWLPGLLYRYAIFNYFYWFK